jgi:hypothetical protein
MAVALGTKKAPFRANSGKGSLFSDNTSGNYVIPDVIASACPSRREAQQQQQQQF